jgi:hypothetical protein
MSRPDPRAEPTTDPPEAKAGQDHSVERVAVSTVTAKETATPDEKPKPTAPAITSDDPRVAELEPLIKANDWKAVASKLGPLDDAGALPPNLGLIAAVAHHEALKDPNPDARALAIRCTASLLGMSANNEVVLVLSRRLLRKNPVRFRERPAPAAKTSALIVLAMLVVGGGLGWFLSSPTFKQLVNVLTRH